MYQPRIQWESLKKKDIKALKARIRTFFQDHDHQDQILKELYRMVIPDWDKVKEIRGYPEIGDQAWLFICRLFMEFDRDHHPDCLPGGAWTNLGFSANTRLGPWDLDYSHCSITYQV
jgi:hypothetical protein